MDVKKHYDDHLGNIYSWMVGDFNEKQHEQQKFFADHGIIGREGSIAFDLGSAHGIHSFALADLGYDVRAVDFNRQLLSELAARKGTQKITIHEDDIIRFLRSAGTQADLIVCMGDTITHLDSKETVSELIQLISARLAPAGKVVISFRDLTKEISGKSRFIPVRSDETKILTCFLEYYEDHVAVHDLLYELIDGMWVQKISSYPKLRLQTGWIIEKLQGAGFEILFLGVAGSLTNLIARKAIHSTHCSTSSRGLRLLSGTPGFGIPT